jgi:hypothetical protein
MSDPVLADALAAMRMPRRGLRHWMRHLERFCRAHGGDKRYARVLALIAECEAQLVEPKGR